MRIAIIGIGRLGSVFARVLSKNHELILFDRNFSDAQSLASDICAKAVKEITLIENPEITILTVKPSQIEEVVKKVPSEQLIVSCAAGVRLKKLEGWGARKVIRVMPNVCAEVGESVIAYTMHAETEKKEKVFLTAFSSLGLCIKTDEDHLDAIGGASSSGPALLSFLAGSMIAEAVRQGLDQKTAEKIVAQTLIGTGKLMKSGWSTNQIMQTVATPGGITEQSLKMLEEKGVSKAISEAVRYATTKAREMGK